jgi:urea transporter
LARVYAQILFSRSPVVGLAVLAATATVPRAFLSGALGVVVARIVAGLLDVDRESVRAGDYGYGALLVGLGVGQTFAPGPATAMLIVAGAAASVIAAAALKSWLGAMSLPVLTLPFLAVFQLVIGAAACAGADPLGHALDPSPLAGALPAGVVLFVRSLGGLFFLPRFDAGALVLAALLLHSRIAASLAASAFTLLLFMTDRMAALPEGAGALGLGYNAMLTAVALGGVFFVPSTSSFVLGLAGALLSVLVGLGLSGPFARMGVPLLILPFNVTVLVTLFALRQRAHDLRPKSVDFLSGTPEENLAYWRTRRSRFEWLHAVPFQLPVRGVWTCTQGIDGAFTHQGAWRHAFDFEVRDADGELCRGEDLTNEDFHCYRLPVLAAADGTVVAVENDVRDNAVGAMDVERNWGNHVLVYHAVGLYSLVAHLSRGSVKVYPGQPVRRGEVLGLAGSSGRSPRPHLHFHLQGTALLGAPTLPCRFTDIVETGEGAPRVATALVPREGQSLRNLEPGDEIQAYLPFEAGRRWSYRIDGEVERLVSDVDLYGRQVIRSRDRQATLFHGARDAFFTAFDALGDKRSVLHLLRAALPRVPLEASPGLAWTDHLPARPFRPWLGRVLLDLLSPFLSRDGIEMIFHLHREGSVLVIEGASTRKDRGGAPLLETRAELARATGPTRVAVTARGRTQSAELCASRGKHDVFATDDEGGLE